LSASAHIPSQKLAVLAQKVDRIPGLQQRIDLAAKKLLEEHRAISALRKEMD